MRAVSEGRKLYDNMLKYIRFMLVALVTYVVTFLMPYPLHRRRAAFSATQNPVDQLPDQPPPSASPWASTRRPRG